jgi:transmembrane sensor
VHLNSGTDKPEDWLAFDQWQAASDAHRKAGERARIIWEQTGPSLLALRKSRFPKVPVIVAAAIGLSGLAFLGGLFGPPEYFFADYRSATGEVRTVVLRDGSEVDLDTGTSFDVRDGDRTIKLYTGQVYVRVKPDPGRSFAVVAGPARAQALGTAFAVRRDGRGATVLVTESSVRVSDERIGAQGAVTLSAGNAVSLTPDHGLGRPQTADVNALTAWRRGVLVFNGRPLAEAVSELERYRWGKIVVLGGSVGNLPVTGNVAIGNDDAFLKSLELVLPVKVLRLPGLVTIRRDGSR